ncbi:MAG: 50S ribosomal protein L25/general stress protein Ctc [Mycobacteriales bacterium]
MAQKTAHDTDQLHIAADVRTEFGKGPARRLRRDGRVPGVIYGHGEDPQHVSLPGHQLMLALKNPNALLTLALPAGDQLALAKAVQRDVIKGFIEHVDLLMVRRGEKVTVEIPITYVGEARPDTVVNHELTVLSVEAEATHLPDGVEVSVEGLGVGDQILAGDVALPTGSSLITEPDQLLVGIQAAPTAEALEAELAEAEAEAGIEHEEAAEPAEGAEEPTEGAEDPGEGGDSADES